ncbi:DUF5518 domain-containing protein [Halobacterium sp. MBLA0001]|uniref:DUF5518 domain-containing protein n=1 Tax=Halobacterium TaxID=2239 RepID=UPI001F23773B|nr:DUF5518 domain-containing protein [Halobacterium salinarum]MCF2240742.1 DUF5518 domain-containing protein [Halobacterium salinarum]MDL0124794.1 DUF5518 domain-containing protein [Halobacterium salinarum]
MVNWRAVLTGFGVSFVLGVFAFALPGIGHAAAGLVGGFVAGWMADDGAWSGAVHGLLAGALGGLVVVSLILAASLVGGLLFVPIGVLGVGAALAALAVFLALAVDSAIAGAIGGLLA